MRRVILSRGCCRRRCSSRSKASVADVAGDEVVVWPIEPKRNGEPVTTVFMTIPVGGTAPPPPSRDEYTSTVEVWSLVDGAFLREFDVKGGVGFAVGPPTCRLRLNCTTSSSPSATRRR